MLTHGPADIEVEVDGSGGSRTSARPVGIGEQRVPQRPQDRSAVGRVEDGQAVDVFRVGESTSPLVGEGKRGKDPLDQGVPLAVGVQGSRAQVQPAEGSALSVQQPAARCLQTVTQHLPPPRRQFLQRHRKTPLIVIAQQQASLGKSQRRMHRVAHKGIGVVGGHLSLVECLGEGVEERVRWIVWGRRPKQAGDALRPGVVMAEEVREARARQPVDGGVDDRIEGEIAEWGHGPDPRCMSQEDVQELMQQHRLHVVLTSGMLAEEPEVDLKHRSFAEGYRQRWYRVGELESGKGQDSLAGQRILGPQVGQDLPEPGLIEVHDVFGWFQAAGFPRT